MDSNLDSNASEGQITALLAQLDLDRPGTIEQLLSLVYQQLKEIARGQLNRRSGNLTLNTTELVHEAWLKMERASGLKNSDHYFAVAARAMRQIIIDHARAHYADRRGSGVRPLSLDQVSVAMNDQAHSLIDLHNRLEALEQRDERLVRVIECRFFAGLSEPDTANALGVSLSTVQRDWTRARAWFALQATALEHSLGDD